MLYINISLSYNSLSGILARLTCYYIVYIYIYIDFIRYDILLSLGLSLYLPVCHLVNIITKLKNIIITSVKTWRYAFHIHFNVAPRISLYHHGRFVIQDVPRDQLHPHPRHQNSVVTSLPYAVYIYIYLCN